MKAIKHHLLKCGVSLILTSQITFSVDAQDNTYKTTLIAVSKDSALYLYQTEKNDTLRFSFYFSVFQSRYNLDSLKISGFFDSISFQILEYKIIGTHPFIMFTYTTKDWGATSYVESWTNYTTRKVVYNPVNKAYFSAIVNYAEILESHIAIADHINNKDSTIYRRQMFIDSLYQIHLTPFHIKSYRHNPIIVQIADTTLVNEKFRYGPFNRGTGIYKWVDGKYQLQH